MPASWQEQFFEKLVAASHGADDQRLATAKLHRRKKTVSFQHPQLRKVECRFGTSRSPGSQAQVLLIECLPKRATEVDAPELKRQFNDAGIGGEVAIEDHTLFFQCRWGFGQNVSFPVHDSRRVRELVQWATRTLTLLFDHMEQRRHILVAKGAGLPQAPLELRIALEKYLEDLLVQQWADLPWAGELQYVDRQVYCGSLGQIDILARDQANGDYVVIELKRDQGDDEVVGQCSRYMGWVAEHMAAPQNLGVRGIIVVHDLTPRLRAAALAHRNLQVYTYKLKVALTRIPLPEAIEPHARDT